MLAIMNRSAIAGVGALLCAGNTATGQITTVGRLEGRITEGLHARSIRTASVEAVRLDAESALTFRATPDDRGRFHIDSMPAGRYMVQLGSATLDSLELAVQPNEMRVVAGETVQADFALPAGVALRDAVCRGVTLGSGKGVVVGRGIDADTEQPLPNAKVVVLWHELRIDKVTLKTGREERGGAVETGPRGEYRLCGVPTGSRLTIQLQHGNRAGGVAHVIVSDDEGAVVRNLSLSVQSSPTMAAFDSLELGADTSGVGAAADSAAAFRLTGTAAVTGIVRGSAGQPLPDVEVRVANAPPVASTDATGKFTLNGLPAGTQLMYVRRIGYAIVEADVELRAGKSVTRDVQLEHVVSLDSIRVLAERSRYPEFEYNRATNIFGRFLTGDEIRHRAPTELSDLLIQMGGFTLSGEGVDVKAMSDVAKQHHPGCKESNVIVDGIPRTGINYLPASQVAGMEVYRDATSAPPIYKSDCGLIVIWTRKYRPARK